MIRPLRPTKYLQLNFGGMPLQSRSLSGLTAAPENVELIRAIHLSVRSFDRYVGGSDRTVAFGSLYGFVD